MAATRRAPNKPVRTTPSQGGRLITRTSSEVPGFENYTWKHDVRRDLTDEIRREGDDYFRPNLSIPIGNQPFPQNQGFVISGFRNGGFEEDNDADGIPDDWTKTVSAGITMSIDTTVFASDGSTQSVKFVSSLGGAEGYLETEAAMPVTAGRIWRAAWKLKASVAGIRVDARVVWYDEDDAVINDPNGNMEWTFYSSTDNPTADFGAFGYHMTPPLSATSGRLRFYGKVGSTVTTGSVWFDSVTLDEANSTVLPITLVHHVRRPNGKACLVVGTKTTLYRYFAFDDGNYFVEDLDPNYFVTTGLGTPFFVETGPGTPVFVEELQQGFFVTTGPGTPVFAANPGEWRIIGSGFSENGHRWEALNDNGYAVFNNGVDLLVTYQEQDESVVPIYELREAGVAFVGTIWENNGVLMCGDIAEMKEATISDNFEHESSGTTEAKEYGSVNSSPLLATKFSGGAVDLGASDSGAIVTFADDPDLEVGIDFTIEAVIKLTATTTDIHTVFGKSDSYRLAVQPISSLFSVLSLQVNNSGWITISSSVLLQNDGGYHHIAVSVTDGTEVRWFIDGLFTELMNESFNSPDVNANPAFCGAGNYTGTSSTSGMVIAELRIWQVARTINEIAENSTVDVTGQTGLTAYWKFDETSGTNALDSTGNGNNGTLSGGAVFISSTADVDAYVITEAITEATLSRLTNVSTFVATAVHHLVTGNTVVITGASVGTFNGTFVVTVVDPFTFTFANAGADTSATGATAHRSFFTLGMVGKFLSFTNGLTVQITSFSSGTKVKVDGSIMTLVGINLPFRLYSTSTAQLTGTVSRTSGLATLVGVGTLFLAELSVGQLIRVPNGTGEEVRKVTVITDNTHLTVDANWVASGAATAVYRVSDFTVLATAEIFQASDVGRHLYWPDGSARTIIAFQNGRRVDVDSHIGVNEDTFDLENVTAYGAITDVNLYDRIQYKCLWGAKDEPRTFASAVGVTIAAGSNVASLAYPIRSLETGMQITILGAGTLGADFSATIVLVAADHRSLILDQAAITGVIDSLLQRTSSIGSIAGFDDLTDDNSSAIIVAEDVRGRTVIFLDESIFVCDYTGDVAKPFAFNRVYQGNDSVYFKNTLTNPKGDYLVYAANTGFYRFDLTVQIPQRLEMFDYIDNQFYPTAKVSDTDEIFAGVCQPTKEIFFMFPAGVNGVQGIAYDFRYETISTLGVAYTAVNTVKRPVPGIPVGVQEDWCVCGGADGTVILYGKANGPQEQWGGASAMFNRRGSAYTSTLRSGLFGGGWREMDITGYLPEISSLSRPNITGLTVNLYGFRNSAEAPKLLFSRAIPKPDQQNLIPCFFRKNYLQDEIVVSGTNNPIRIAARSVEAGGVNSDSQTRRPT